MIYNPTYQRNNRKRKEFSRGKLYKQGSKISVPFEYSLKRARNFSNLNSAMPFEYTSVTESISTSRLDIPFNKNDSIELQDGRRMTIDAATYDIDESRAHINSGIVGWILYLDGGK